VVDIFVILSIPNRVRDNGDAKISRYLLGGELPAIASNAGEQAEIALPREINRRDVFGGSGAVQPDVRQACSWKRGGVIVLKLIRGEGRRCTLVGLVDGGGGVSLIHFDSEAVFFSVHCF